MLIRKITLQDFRNVAWAELTFEGRQQFFVGRNGQGKTNLLEAAGFVFALRSFRTHDHKDLIAHGKSSAAIACDIEHERLGRTRVVIKLGIGTKEVSCDGTVIPKLGDFLGRFPTVIFSSQDLQFIRGGPALRRRWMDLVLSATSAPYLVALQRYHRALEGRNRLLKDGKDTSAIFAFEQPLSEAACFVRNHRKQVLSRLAEIVDSSYGAISGASEIAGFTYHQSGDASTPADWLALWGRQRARDLVLRSTQTGPHKDDCDLTVSGRAARDFASEGQQRSLALALRLSEWDYLRQSTGVQPVLLADDVLGELDSGRRERFWGYVGGERQILATGTSLPDADLGAWQVFKVTAGAFTPHRPGSGGAVS